MPMRLPRFAVIARSATALVAVGAPFAARAATAQHATHASAAPSVAQAPPGLFPGEF
jgi:hypothetical protein